MDKQKDWFEEAKGRYGQVSHNFIVQDVSIKVSNGEMTKREFTLPQKWLAHGIYMTKKTARTRVISSVDADLEEAMIPLAIEWSSVQTALEKLIAD